MASGEPIREVFVRTTRNVLKKLVASGIAVGLGPTWCLDTIDEVMAQIRREILDDQTDHRR